MTREEDEAAGVRPDPAPIPTVSLSRWSRLRNELWRTRDHPVDPGVRGALLRYRVMAYIVGSGLLVIFCVGLPLEYGFGHPIVDQVVGTIHGWMYIVYLVASYDLARRDRWGIPRILLSVGAGFVPGLAFVIEHFNRKLVEADIAAASGEPTVDH